ncbi:MAG: hypothetical protein O8C64_14615 [Candidatus Methanoperedens sp.]|nr:hypothetical protein [Candidatus Methanoperedens sp.]MCZ7405374.1 hypothetical protein [Candidatus Methanoperedens sp.]
MKSKSNDTTTILYEYLDYLQRTRAPPGYAPDKDFDPKSVQDNLKRVFKEDTDEEIAEEMSKMKKRLDTKMPTELEDPGLYNILQSITSDVVQMATELNLVIPKEVVFGTLPTGEVNAIAICVPGEGVVVALNHGIFMFIYKLAKVVESFIPLKGEKDGFLIFSTLEKDILHSLNINKEGHICFIEILFGYLVLGHPGYARRFKKNPPMHPVALLTGTAERFVVAHEYSHIILRHSASGASTEKRLLGNVEVEEIPRSWRDEPEADSLALQITMAINLKNRYDPSMSFAGIDFFFSCVEILEQATGTGSSKSHPSAVIRRETLREDVKTLSEGIKEKFSNHAEPTALGIVIQKIMSELWKRNQPKFEKMRSSASRKKD